MNIKKIGKSILNIYFNIPYFIIKLFRGEKKAAVTTMRSMSYVVEKGSNYFVSARFRPKKSTFYNNLSMNSNLEDVAVVLQGPVLYKDDFTFETIKLYKKLYPNALIVLSTWKDEKDENLEKFKQLNINILQSEYPTNPGWLNVNYQITNSKAGIDFAKRKGVQYVLKTRTDQRIYHPNALEYLVSLIRTFDLNNHDSEQKRRIICGSMEYGNLFFPYLISDFFYFGVTEDISRLFNIPLDAREKGRIVNGISRREHSKNNYSPETYIMKEYAKQIGVSIDESVRSYWDFMKNSLICINKDDIGLYWDKYETKYIDSYRNGHYNPNEEDGKYEMYNSDFIQWLNIYTGEINYDKYYEKFADYII